MDSQICVKVDEGDPEIFITENGYDKRLTYCREYLSHIRDAMLEDDVKVTGYTIWSFMDNFEWTSGYSVKYGMYSVYFNSPNRTMTPKNSTDYFKKVFRTGCLVDNCSD